mmetsp:Transcript_50737/g.120850  ORF Transcript_50737/g.120850 Transcript_50737/m.120850 type:complete len:83 (+) Transcript_50737:54-302(+)
MLTTSYAKTGMLQRVRVRRRLFALLLLLLSGCRVKARGPIWRVIKKKHCFESSKEEEKQGSNASASVPGSSRSSSSCDEDTF